MEPLSAHACRNSTHMAPSHERTQHRYNVVAAGLDTDCNGATVGALWALQGKPIPAHWTTPWQGKVGVSLAGLAQLELEDLVERTVEVAANLNGVRT